MRHKITIEPRAQADVIEIKKWYRVRKPGLENEFIDKLKQNLFLLAENPMLFQIRYKALRAVVFKKFPFLAYYFISKNEVYIITVLAAKQNQSEVLQKR
ncbi:MAG TPA: type II toxin-antitoxin system RelE/ParE family toxin [Bacteroidia bacterium]|jgi:plasmid stabilization system protein ParE|nr:type II toxin-antitoxin system RelE/ParE family toxin [Bacteroidia bacterium]